ncbi:MAG: UDP-N-acetylglucosamine diphosphorylase [Oscillospiraceae bacterium]|nr:UDP-N-acetylglucosamine diphosphorylase [Oscillospiraceae bacterium]
MDSTQNFKELREKNQEEQKKIIEELERNGVQFVSLDGVGISPMAIIEHGTVIYQGTIIRGNSKIGKNNILGPNTIIDNSVIGENCVINSTQIESSTIENNVTAGPFCHIRPNCLIKSGVHLGNFVEVKNSTLGENTKAGHLTYIGDSDVGKDVNFGCGAITVNYDGIKKARCNIGDRAFIGCNTNLVAPINIGDDGYIAAGSTLTKDVPAGALAISRTREQKIIHGWVVRHRNKSKNNGI